MVTIYIDDQAYEVEDGANVLQAALDAGLDLPYFCWHPEMGSVGACRQCALVQFRDAEDTRGRIVMGCMTAVTDGARFSMTGASASEFRENIVESLMLNHPHDCPVCAEGGECHLQDMTVMVGHRDRRYRGKKNTHRNQDLGPLINHEMNRCIACYRCTRFYQDYAGGTDLAAHAAHDHVYFGRHQDGTLESEFSGNLVEVCPTGVFTDKPLVNDYTRKWDLQSAPSVCGGCALGCNTLPGERYGQLKRIHNRYNNEVNGYFLCDRGRYGHSYVNDDQRPQFPGLRTSDDRFDAISNERALALLDEWLQGSKIAAVGSPRASLESNYLLRELVGPKAFCAGIADQELTLLAEIYDTLRHGSVNTPSMQDVEAADAVFILGEDVTNTAPRLALSLRQAVRNRAKAMASAMHIPLWQDEAVRNLAQDQLSPLFIAAHGTTPLDDIAVNTYHEDPAGIARLGFAVAAKIDPSLPAVSGLSNGEQTRASEIAAALSSATQPLIVSGTSSQSMAVIQAAAAIAHALANQSGNNKVGLSYCLAEANSLGQTMLVSSDNLGFAQLIAQAEDGEIDTLVVLENDLYRRAPSEQIEILLRSITQLVVIDSLPNRTMERATLVLPAATILESEGTLVSSEGRAQRHFPVFLAAQQRAPSWQWLTRIGQKLGNANFAGIKYFDDVCAACAKDNPPLADIEQAAPAATYRNRGLKIPRQPHRYSGRTAMHADISVHEPKQPDDQDTALAYSMEGRNGTQPGALLPFVWAPGWNSNQALHRFQSEIGGPLKGGTAGVRLISAQNVSNYGRAYAVPVGNEVVAGNFRVQPIYKIFGSEELSAYSPAIAELCPTPFAQFNAADLQQLGVAAGDPLTVTIGQRKVLLKAELNDTLKTGSIGIGVGLPNSPFISAGELVEVLNMVASDD